MTEEVMKEDTKILETKLVANKDWFLQSLVCMANDSGIKFGITLNVSGFLVSGTLIGIKEYFKLFGESFASGMEPGDAANSVKATYAEYGNLYDPELKPKSPSFIHLVDTKFHTTNGVPVPSNQGTLWRGRLSEVGGFILGSLDSKNNSN